MENPYGNFIQKELILRDWLALDRTVLANERTFLAYGRTSLTLVIAGLTFVKFFGHVAYSAIGYAFIVAGISIFYFGIHRYQKNANRLAILRKVNDDLVHDQHDPQLDATAEALRRTN